MPSVQKAGSAEPVDVDALLATYRAWLARQSLATRSQEAYAAQVARFLGWLVSSEHGARALTDPHVRDWAVRDYKRHVKSEARWAPSSVNQALAAIDNFYRSLGAGRPDVPREDLPQLAPRALEEDEQRRFLRAVQASPSPRDRVALAAGHPDELPRDRSRDPAGWQRHQSHASDRTRENAGYVEGDSAGIQVRLTAGTRADVGSVRHLRRTSRYVRATRRDPSSPPRDRR